MSIAELFRAAVAGDETAVHQLRLDGREEVYAEAVEHCGSAIAAERAAGLTVLSQWQLAPERHILERVELGLRALNDPEQKVAVAGAWLIAYMNMFSDEALAALRKLAANPDCDVRMAVAVGLGMRMGDSELETMLGLMTDADADVRNWATFGVGSDATMDGAAVRGALRARLEDSFTDVRLEALWGLALRRDAQVLRMLAERFASDAWVSGDEDAAEEVLGVEALPEADEVAARLRALIRPALS